MPLGMGKQLGIEMTAFRHMTMAIERVLNGARTLATH